MLVVSSAAVLAASGASAAGQTIEPAAPTSTALAADQPGTRPASCSNHFRDRNVRRRTVNETAGTYLHEMSNSCSPHGQVLGTLPYQSTFDLYYADPYEPEWCYGYSYYLQRNGYALCGKTS